VLRTQFDNTKVSRSNALVSIWKLCHVFCHWTWPGVLPRTSRYGLKVEGLLAFTWTCHPQLVNQILFQRVNQIHKMLNLPTKLIAVCTKCTATISPPLSFAWFVFTLWCLIMFWVHVMHVLDMLWVSGVLNM
jgi:hypothetical protein